MNTKGVIILLATSVAFVASTVHLLQEFYLIETVGTFLLFLMAWNAMPALNLVMFRLLRSTAHANAPLVLAWMYAGLFGLYVVRGSTRDDFGAEHMHIFIAPVLCMVIAIVHYAVVLMFAGIRRLPPASLFQYRVVDLPSTFRRVVTKAGR
jgi:hypothetical protein